MSVSLLLLIAMMVMFATGFALMLDRGLTRVVLGFILVGNATNLLIFLMSGNFGTAPLHGQSRDEDMSDPLPQAFILTAIVISFAVTAFVLALIYRAYRLDREDVDAVLDDAADIELAQTTTLTTEEVSDEELEEHSDFDTETAVDEKTAFDSAADTSRSAQHSRGNGETSGSSQSRPGTTTGGTP